MQITKLYARRALPVIFSKNLMRKAAIVLAVLTLTTVGFSGSAIADPGGGKGPKEPFANVIARAECTTMDTYNEVLVTVSLEQSEVLGPSPEAGNVFLMDGVTPAMVVLWEHTRKPNSWDPIVGSGKKIDPIANPGMPLPAGELYPVGSVTYTNICMNSLFQVDPTANAIRAVVMVDVMNSNPDRKRGTIHTGRCISFPNPCRQ